MGTRDTNKQDKSKAKPVLLMHGANDNLFSFFGKTDDSLPSVPERLVNDGFDVYLYQRHGGLYQKNRLDENGVPIDPDTIPNNEFWDFTSEEIGEVSLQKLVYAIIDDRKELSEGGCQKVSIVAHSLGT